MEIPEKTRKFPEQKKKKDANCDDRERLLGKKIYILENKLKIPDSI